MNRFWYGAAAVTTAVAAVVSYMPMTALASTSLEQRKKALVSAFTYAAFNFIVVHFLKGFQIQRLNSDFCSTGCFHDCLLKSLADGHYFTCCLHLSSKVALCIDEFIKGELRHLYDNIIQDRFKTCCSFLCYGIWNFIKCITDGDQGCDFGNRVTCSL